jgi:hypothetical protein
MDLSPQLTMKAAISAVLFVKDKTSDELKVMQQQLATKELREQVAADFQEQLVKLSSDMSEDVFQKYVTEIVDRMFANINLRLSAPVE